MYCKYCGTRIDDDDSIYCFNCGKRLIEDNIKNKRADNAYTKTIQDVIKELSPNDSIVMLSPNIEKVKNIRKSCNINDNIDVLAIIDNTIWGSAKEGIAFTNKGLFSKKLFESSCFISWEDFLKSKFSLDEDKVKITLPNGKQELLESIGLKKGVLFNFIKNLKKELIDIKKQEISQQENNSEVKKVPIPTRKAFSQKKILDDNFLDLEEDACCNYLSDNLIELNIQKEKFVTKFLSYFMMVAVANTLKKEGFFSHLSISNILREKNDDFCELIGVDDNNDFFDIIYDVFNEMNFIPYLNELGADEKQSKAIKVLIESFYKVEKPLFFSMRDKTIFILRMMLNPFIPFYMLSNTLDDLCLITVIHFIVINYCSEDSPIDPIKLVESSMDMSTQKKLIHMISQKTKSFSNSGHKLSYFSRNYELIKQNPNDFIIEIILNGEAIILTNKTKQKGLFIDESIYEKARNFFKAKSKDEDLILNLKNTNYQKELTKNLSFFKNLMNNEDDCSKALGIIADNICEYHSLYDGDPSSSILYDLLPLYMTIFPLDNLKLVLPSTAVASMFYIEEIIGNQDGMLEEDLDNFISFLFEHS